MQSVTNIQWTRDASTTGTLHRHLASNEAAERFTTLSAEESSPGVSTNWWPAAYRRESLNSHDTDASAAGDVSSVSPHARRCATVSLSAAADIVPIDQAVRPAGRRRRRRRRSEGDRCVYIARRACIHDSTRVYQPCRRHNTNTSSRCAPCRRPAGRRRRVDGCGRHATRVTRWPRDRGHQHKPDCVDPAPRHYDHTPILTAEWNGHTKTDDIVWK